MQVARVRVEVAEVLAKRPDNAPHAVQGARVRIRQPDTLGFLPPLFYVLVGARGADLSGAHAAALTAQADAFEEGRQTDRVVQLFAGGFLLLGGRLADVFLNDLLVLVAWLFYFLIALGDHFLADGRCLVLLLLRLRELRVNFLQARRHTIKRLLLIERLRNYTLEIGLAGF